MYEYDKRPTLRRGLANVAYTLLGSVMGSLLVLALLTNGMIKIPAAMKTAVVNPQASSVPTQPASGSSVSPAVDIARKVGPAVVGIINKINTGSNNPFVPASGDTGSGVIFDSRGYIVTNYHVVSGGGELEVVLADGRRLQAKLVGSDDATDLAVVKVDADKLTTASFGDSDKLQAGDLAVAIGNPLGEDYYGSVTAGIVSATHRIVDVDGKEYVDLIQTDAAINPGNSGGALINSQGEVIGINSVKIGGQKVEGMGFAIPSATVRRVVSDLVEKGKVTRPWIGVIYQGDVNSMANVPAGVQYGVMVKVVEQGPAQKAGIQDGDVIVAVNGEKIGSFADLQRVIFDGKIGDKLEVTVFRGGKQVKIPVALEQKPAQ